MHISTSHIGIFPFRYVSSVQPMQCHKRSTKLSHHYIKMTKFRLTDLVLGNLTQKVTPNTPNAHTSHLTYYTQHAVVRVRTTNQPTKQTPLKQTIRRTPPPTHPRPHFTLLQVSYYFSLSPCYYHLSSIKDSAEQ